MYYISTSTPSTTHTLQHIYLHIYIHELHQLSQAFAMIIPSFAFPLFSNNNNNTNNNRTFVCTYKHEHNDSAQTTPPVASGANFEQPPPRPSLIHYYFQLPTTLLHYTTLQLQYSVSSLASACSLPPHPLCSLLCFYFDYIFPSRVDLFVLIYLRSEPLWSRANRLFIP